LYHRFGVELAKAEADAELALHDLVVAADAKWILSRRYPERYGDPATRVELSGSLLNAAPVEINLRCVVAGSPAQQAGSREADVVPGELELAESAAQSPALEPEATFQGDVAAGADALNGRLSHVLRPKRSH
jgi:hypothetical protein